MLTLKRTVTTQWRNSANMGVFDRLNVPQTISLYSSCIENIPGFLSSYGVCHSSTISTPNQCSISPRQRHRHTAVLSPYILLDKLPFMITWSYLSLVQDPCFPKWPCKRSRVLWPHHTISQLQLRNDKCLKPLASSWCLSCLVVLSIMTNHH